MEAATEQTQQHSRQQAKLLTAQLQAAQSAAALEELLPVPPLGALAAAAQVEMEDRWRLAVGSMLRSTLDTFAADRTVRARSVTTPGADVGHFVQDFGDPPPEPSTHCGDPMLANVDR